MKEHECKNLIESPIRESNYDVMPFWYDEKKKWVICVDSDYHCFKVLFCPHCGEELK